MVTRNNGVLSILDLQISIEPGSNGGQGLCKTYEQGSSAPLPEQCAVNKGCSKPFLILCICYCLVGHTLTRNVAN